MPTPLRSLPDIARECGIAQLLYKDEAERFGLGSFKALGGTYAVACALQRHISRTRGLTPGVADLMEGKYADLTRAITVVCATDGNHGTAVAAGARWFGCRSVIVVHTRVSRHREQLIERQGADVVRLQGTYDDAVNEALKLAIDNGWELVADTSDFATFDSSRSCIDVMHGYTVLAAEVLEELTIRRLSPPTHLFIQGGVGGLAAAMAAHFTHTQRGDAPAIVVVEPESADCLFQSARRGSPEPASGDLDTVMSGLGCGRVSQIAWEVLRDTAEVFMTISDAQVIEVMRSLAARRAEARIAASPSAVAGLAALSAASEDPAARESIGLNATSRILTFGTEGISDASAYSDLIGGSNDQAE
ncbi:MAG: diaminopropionate ammonia-lyase [Steroidobacteraceae bacterium]